VTGRGDRTIERVGRYGSPQKEALEQGFPEKALFTQNGPNEALLIGARSTWQITRNLLDRIRLAGRGH
jgi:hypothetical protein